MRKLFLALAVLWLVLIVGVALLFAVPWLMRNAPWNKPTGPVLTYQVDPEPRAAGRQINMDHLVDAVDERLNSGHARRAVVRTCGSDKLEVALIDDNRETLASVHRLLARLGTLEFRILANNQDHEELIALARKVGEKTMDIMDPARGELLGRWVPADAKGEFGEQFWALDPERREALVKSSEITLRERKQPGGGRANDVLVVMDPYNVDGSYLVSAQAGNNNNRPCVEFAFNNQGARMFGELTSHNLPDSVQNFSRKLGIILDGKLYTAPSLKSTITDRGEITNLGNYRDVKETVDVLNAGALPARLRLISEVNRDSGAVTPAEVNK